MSRGLRWTLRAAFLFAVGGLAPASAANVDWGQTVFDSVNHLVDTDGGLFVPYGIGMSGRCRLPQVDVGLVSDSLHRLGMIAAGHMHFDLDSILKTLFQVWFCTQLLNHWMTPFGGMAHSLHQIPMYLSDAIVSGLATSKVDQLMAYIKAASEHMDHPNPLAILDTVVYILILFCLGVLALATFVLTSFAYIGEVIFVVILPLFVWCTFFHTVFSWFWNCVQNLFAFAAYKVVGALLIYVLSDVLVNFFVNGVGTDYSLGHWMVLFPMVVVFTGLFVFSLFLVPLLCASIFNGAGAVGQAVTLAAKKFF